MVENKAAQLSWLLAQVGGKRSRVHHGDATDEVSTMGITIQPPTPPTILIETDGRPRNRPVSKLLERINHDEDHAADRRAGECWDGLGIVGCSREAQAYPAPHPDTATRNFFGYRSADNTTLSYNAIRSLWGIRKSNRISHRPISWVVLLVIGGRDKRGTNLEQHNEGGGALSSADGHFDDIARIAT